MFFWNFLEFLNLFLAYYSKPITLEDPYILDSTEGMGQEGSTAYIPVV